MKKIEGGITAAKGYKAAGIFAGIKKKKKDLALVYSEVPAVSAGTFTTNIVKAAPVKWDMQIIKENMYAQAVILNSGVANACTGEEGIQANLTMAQSVAEELNIDTKAVLTASTGVIGKPMPIDIIKDGIKKIVPELQEGIKAGTLAAESIMTTDTISKEYAVETTIGGKVITIGGMAKGSGMIHPNMATMLGVVTTDVCITKELLQEALKNNVKKTFNMISVDRDTSTNDSLILLANGLAGNRLIDERNEDYERFCEALNEVNTGLSKLLAGDGEGAGKLLEASIIHAPAQEDAMVLSKAIITSNLVKTAVFGNDANWGRILCAMGYSGAAFNPDSVDLYIESEAGRLKLVENGMAADYSEEIAAKILSGKEIKAIADLKCGDASATAWGCDLTYDYVKINADYRS